MEGIQIFRASDFKEGGENLTEKKEVLSHVKEEGKALDFQTQVDLARSLREKIVSKGSPLESGKTFDRSSSPQELSGSPSVSDGEYTPESVAADFDAIQKIWETAAQDLEHTASPERYKEFLNLTMRAAEDVSLLENFLKENRNLTSEENFYLQMLIEVKKARLLEQAVLPHSPHPEIDHWPKDKQQAWEQKKQELKAVGFEHGEQGIERGILETVIVLNLLGLNTSESCEGHTNKGSNVPFIVLEPELVSQLYGNLPNETREMYARARPGSREREDFLLRAKVDVELLKTKLQKYLNEFNARSPHDPYNFVISDFTPGQSFMIAPQGFDPSKKFKFEYKAAILAEARKKMKLLTKFLQDKYLAVS